MIDSLYNMPCVVTAMAQLDQGPRKILGDMGPAMNKDPIQTAANTAAARKRKRSRKIHSDKKFVCTHEDCGKSYSRAEHLYRHQLNRKSLPGIIYLCVHANRTRLPQTNIPL